MDTASHTGQRGQLSSLNQLGGNPQPATLDEHFQQPQTGQSSIRFSTVTLRSGSIPCRGLIDPHDCHPPRTRPLAGNTNDTPGLVKVWTTCHCMTQLPTRETHHIRPVSSGWSLFRRWPLSPGCPSRKESNIFSNVVVTVGFTALVG